MAKAQSVPIRAERRESGETGARPLRGLLDQIALGAVGLALVLALAAYAIAPFLAYAWLQRPFLGAFFEHTNVYNAVQPTPGEHWALTSVFAGYGYRITAVDGQPVTTSGDLAQALTGKQIGDEVTLTYANEIERSALEPDQPALTATVTVALAPFPLRDVFSYFLLPYLIGLCYLGVGTWVFLMRRGEVSGRAFTGFCACVAILLGALFDLYTTHAFTRLWTAALPLAGAALFTLALVFPQEAGFTARWPALRWIAFVPAIALALAAEARLYDYAHPVAYAGAWGSGYLFTGAATFFFLGMTAYRLLRAASPIAREQSRVILLGGMVAFLPIAVWFAANAVLPGVSQPAGSLPFYAAIFLPPLAIFPVALAYAVLRYRVLGTDHLISQALVYAVLGALVVIGHGLLIAGASLILGTLLPAGSPLVLGLLVFVLVLAFNPVRDRLQRAVNAIFFRSTSASREAMQTLGHRLTRALDLEQIAGALREQITAALQPVHFYLFLRRLGANDYAAYGGRGRPDTDIRFAAEGDLARTLAAQPGVLYLTPDTPLPASLARDRARLAVLGSTVYLPLPASRGDTPNRPAGEAAGRPLPAGWLALGPRQTGEPYSRQDLSFLEAIADQAAVAVERAQVVADLERRLTELNVLSQVSQAVNFTISFDDLLELIYAQAAKVLDASNFHIVLRDPHGAEPPAAGPRDELRGGSRREDAGGRKRDDPAGRKRDDPPGRLYYAFFVERNERINTAEGRAFPMGQGLASEIIRNGQPILTDDYRLECERRGVRSLGHPYRAWLGVPLNAGASGTVGAMVAAALDPSVTFSPDQLKIFWALADQAATAIEKARLYRETEQRARQLATLNEVAQSLASTLALKPLLQQIIASAAEVLLVEAGSLFLLDEDTGEFTFTAATGPAAPDLLGTRVPADSGIVGAAAASGQPILVNDAEHDPRVFRFTDQATGFVTRSLLAAPMVVKERTLGVIEVVNRRDGRDFDASDQTLLQAFASQAAVSIENARLYTLTDAALNMRVEELSTLQRMDRELNTALDVRKAIGIMLDWAMRTTGAIAGTAGVVVSDGVLLLAAEGYGGALDEYRERPVPLDRGSIGQAVRTGETSLARDLAAAPDYLPAHTAALARLTLPIRRENDAIGVLVLESDRADAFGEDQVAFMTRLADHASIAITNARLFAEVQQANQAKSEFVSFVSHELKTPMTSIKGYADLLAGGLGGPISATQSQFLNTIRANVERMASLVSDLADISRIEAGRMRLDLAAVPLPAVVDDVVHSIAGQFEAKQQTLELQIAPDLPAVWADQIRLAQVLTNLLSNAYKYTPEGGRVTLQAEAVANGWDTSEGAAAQVVHVAVQDTGIGIAPEEQKHIFTKFFRSEDRAVREVTGTGLGLNIFKNLVELQGGRAWFESDLGVGSTFHFTVPVAKADRRP